MAAADALSPQDYAALSALFDELSELDAPTQLRRMQQLRAEGHPLAARLTRMLAALDGPRTDALLPPLPPASAHTDRAAGQCIGPWRLLAPLGRGGMAEVWLACREDGGLKREVALKLPFLPPGSTGALRAQRFERERDILGALRHPHIATLLDAGVEPDGQAWLALERVDGERITDWCDERRATLAQRIALFVQVLLAVQHAHGQLVIHRDLKPANVLVNAQGEARLLDFGIAKLLGEGQPMLEDTALTQQAGHPLTPRYASPEQLRGEPLSTASDVYALGVLLHELLTGRLPYALAHGGAAELERAIVEADVPLPSKTLPTVAAATARGTTPRALQRALAPEFDAVLLRALAKQPAERYRSVDALLDDIERWRAGVPVRARTPSSWFRLRRFVARHPLGVGTGVVAVAGLAGLALAATLFGLRAREESARATVSRDFLLEVFRKADTDQSKGADISAREMLDWGRRRAAGLSVQPDLRAELLMDIGRSQMEAEDYAGALPSFSEAAQLYRELGRADGVVLAETQRAEIALRLRDVAVAARHLAAARAAMPANPEPELVAQMEHKAGWLATLQGRDDEAATHDERAARAAERAWPAKDDRHLQVMVRHARSMAAVGRAEEGVQLLDALLDRLVAGSDVDAPQRATLEFDRAAIVLGLGRYGAAAARLRPALQHCETEVGAATEKCNLLRRVLALALLRRGEQAAAEGLLGGIRREIQSTDNPFRRSEAVLMASRVLASAGVYDEAGPPWTALQAMASGGTVEPLSEDFRVQAQQALAEALLRAGRPAQAQAWIKASRQRIATAGVPMPVRQLRAQVLAAVAQSLEGRVEEAAAAWAAVRQEAARIHGEQHPMTWTYAANAVPTLRAAGRPQEAQALAAQSLPALVAALGPDAPHVLRVARWSRDPAAAVPAAPLDFLL